MVMGRTHAMSGAAAYLAAAAFAGTIVSTIATDSPAVFVMGTLITAGAALAPDIDSHSSTLVSSFGVFGRMAHQVANSISMTIYNATRAKYDKPRNNGHRTFFHTGLFAIIATLIVSFLGSLSQEVTVLDKSMTLGQICSLVIMFIFTHMALAGLFEPVRKARRKYGPYVMMAVSAIFTLTIAYFMPEDTTYPWLGLCVGLGWFMHLLGDLITKMGVPLVFPIKVHGKRWYDVALPSVLRISANGTFENVVLFPGLTILTGVLLFFNVPGMKETILGFFS